ncbi:MAG TPA: hypothetical protein PLV04_13485, partial [Phenylobacterium sp.]|nr:hypothetical protein [Phenylobacterium sp.]
LHPRRDRRGERRRRPRFRRRLPHRRGRRGDEPGRRAGFIRREGRRFAPYREKNGGQSAFKFPSQTPVRIRVGGREKLLECLMDISARKEAEEAMQRLNRQLEKAIARAEGLVGGGAAVTPFPRKRAAGD